MSISQSNLTSRQVEALQILAGRKSGRVHLNTTNALHAKGLIEYVPTGEVCAEGRRWLKTQLTEAGKLALKAQS